jgi:RNA polymerase sigma factor (sigma-70 family)
MQAGRVFEGGEDVQRSASARVVTSSSSSSSCSRASQGYARTRIRGAVLDELRAQDWLTRRARDAVNAAAQRDEGEIDGAILVGLDELSAVDEEEFLVSSKLDPAAAYEAKETFQILALALDKLPERERKVIGMSYFDDKKYREIGAELNVSEPRVSQLHARALERLKGAFRPKRFRRARFHDGCPDALEPESSQDDWDDAFPMNDPPPDVA